MAFLSLIPTLSVAQDNLAPDGTPRETYFAPFPVSITLDGDFGDWDGVPRVIIPEGANRDAGQTSVLFAAAADSEFLYFMGDIAGGTSILEAIESTVSDNTQVYYDQEGDFVDLVGADGNLIIADVAIAVVGERPYAEGIGDDADLALSEEDLAVIDALQEHSRQVVVVLISGRPLIITDQIGNWDAVVAAWLPGTEGLGVADVLFGLHSFGGRLPFTWPQLIEQLPFGQDTQQALFPLGYGLLTQSN